MLKFYQLIKFFILQFNRIFIQNRYEASKFLSIYTRLIGGIYFICFLSVIFQFNDLFGPNGIDKRMGSFLSDIYYIDLFSFVSFPSLRLLLIVGLLFSIALIIGYLPFYLILINISLIFDFNELMISLLERLYLTS